MGSDVITLWDVLKGKKNKWANKETKNSLQKIFSKLKVSAPKFSKVTKHASFPSWSPYKFMISEENSFMTG